MLQSGIPITRTCAKSVLQTSVHRTAAICMAPTRGTAIFRRKYPPPLHKKGQHPRLKRAQYVYEMEENTFTNPRSKTLQVLLTDHVDGVGLVGEELEVPKNLFRNHLFPAGLAVYPTEDNKLEIQDKMKKLADDLPVLMKLSKYSRLTAVKMMGCHVPVSMSGENDWTLKPSHIKVSLRKLGVIVNEECIALPDESITEPGEITFTLTINGVLPIPVRATIYQVFEDKAKNVETVLPEPWNNKPVDIDAVPSILKPLAVKMYTSKTEV